MESALGEGPPSSGLTAAAIFIATSLYGAFLILFTLSTLVLHSQILVNKKQSSGYFGTSVYLTLGYILFFTVSLSWVTLWMVSIHPSLNQVSEDGTRYGVFLYIQSIAERFAAVVADWILLFRLYIIWNKKSVILIISAVILILQAAVVTCDSVHYARQRTSWVAGNYILSSSTLLTNIGATALITWKLWNTNRHLRDIGGSKVLKKVIGIIVESAAVSTTYTVVYLILFLTNRNASYYLLHCLPSVAGIAATLVNVRVGFGRAVGEQGRSTWSLHDSSTDFPAGIHD